MRKLKLSSILDPTLDAEVQIMSTTEITNCYEEYKKRFGDCPTPEADVSPVQFSALKQVLDSGAVPFADFSIFGPFGTRRLRKQTFMAYQLNVAVNWTLSGHVHTQGFLKDIYRIFLTCPPHEDGFQGWLHEQEILEIS